LFKENVNFEKATLDIKLVKEGVLIDYFRDDKNIFAKFNAFVVQGFKSVVGFLKR
jgi:hypothetical protein